MTPKDFRRIALGLEGAVEGAHMGHPDFRAGGKIFATIHPDHLSGMVKLTPDQQEKFVEDHPTIFTPENGAWGRAGCTRVRLETADEETVGEAMTLAWQEAHKTKATPRQKASGPRPQAPGPTGQRHKAEGTTNKATGTTRKATAKKHKAKTTRQKATVTKQKAKVTRQKAQGKSARLKAKGNAT